MKKKKDPEAHNYFEGFSMDEIEDSFQNLAEEVKSGSIGMNNLLNKDNQVNEQNAKIPYFRGYNPGIYDFLARAETDQECVDVIEYCLQKGEISEDQAKFFLLRLKKGGPQIFGSRKPGYYDSKL